MEHVRSAQAGRRRVDYPPIQAATHTRSQRDAVLVDEPLTRAYRANIQARRDSHLHPATVHDQQRGGVSERIQTARHIGSAGVAQHGPAADTTAHNCSRTHGHGQRRF